MGSARALARAQPVASVTHWLPCEAVRSASCFLLCTPVRCLPPPAARLHTQLSHTSPHPTLSHKNLSRTFLSQTTLSHTQLCDTQLFHTQLTWWHPRCLCGKRGTWWHRGWLCVAGVALGDIDVTSVWQTWHLATSTSLRRLCVASVALSDIDVTSVHAPSSTLARNSFTHDSFTHSTFAYNSFNYRSSTTSFVFPASPVQLQPRFVIFWRDWLVGLSGPFIFWSRLSLRYEYGNLYRFGSNMFLL